MIIELLVLFAHLVPIQAHAGRELQHQIDAAIRRGDPKFVIPTGVYDWGNETMRIIRASNFFLTTHPPVHFIFHPSAPAVDIRESNHTRVGGFSVDYSPVPHSQGVITQVVKEPPGFIMRVDSGFPVPDIVVNPWFKSRAIKAIYFNRTTKRMISPQVNDFMKTSKRLTADTYQITLRHGNDVKDGYLTVGVAVVVAPRASVGGVHTVFRGWNITSENITYYAAPNIIFAETGGLGGNLYRNLRVSRHPNPQQQPFRYIAGNDGGFNLESTVQAATVEHCYLEHVGDDFYNVHDTFFPVLTRVSAREVIIVSVSDREIVPHLDDILQLTRGDKLHFYHPVNQNSLGYAIVDSYHQTTNATYVAEAAKIPQLYKTKYGIYIVYGKPGGMPWKPYIWSVTVSSSTPIPEDILELTYANVDLVNGAVIQHNTFIDGYVTIAKIKSLNSIFRENYCAYPHQDAAIVLEADATFMEGNIGLRNITVEDNVFCGVTPEHNITVSPHATNIVLRNNTVHCRM